MEKWNKCSAPHFMKQQPNPLIILNEKMTNLSFRGGTACCKLITWLWCANASQLLHDPVVYYFFAQIIFWVLEILHHIFGHIFHNAPERCPHYNIVHILLTCAFYSCLYSLYLHLGINSVAFLISSSAYCRGFLSQHIRFQT